MSELAKIAGCSTSSGVLEFIENDLPAIVLAFDAELLESPFYLRTGAYTCSSVAILKESDEWDIGRTLCRAFFVKDKNDDKRVGNWLRKVIKLDQSDLVPIISLGDICGFLRAFEEGFSWDGDLFEKGLTHIIIKGLWLENQTFLIANELEGRIGIVSRNQLVNFESEIGRILNVLLVRPDSQFKFKKLREMTSVRSILRTVRALLREKSAQMALSDQPAKLILDPVSVMILRRLAHCWFDQQGTYELLCAVVRGME